MGKLDQLRALPMRSLYRKADPVPVVNEVVNELEVDSVCLTEPTCKPKQKDRHKPGYKKEYMRHYMRAKRAREKAAKQPSTGTSTAKANSSTLLAALKAAGAHWIKMIATVTAEWYPSRDTALAFEAAAIKAEHPLHNIQHNRGCPKTKDRHSPGYQKAYQREYQRKRRAAAKAARK